MLGLPATLNFVTGTATAGGTYSPATRTLDWKSGSSTAHECGAYSFKVTVAGPLTGMHQMLNIQMGAVESQNGKNFSYQESRPFTAWPWAKNAAAPALATPTPTPPFWRKLARAFEGKASGDANPLAQYLSVSKRIIAIPNPASSVMTVAFLTDLPGEAHLAFYSIDGREVFNRDLGQLAAGIGETSIPVAGLAPGVYFIDLEMNSGGGFVSAGMSKVAIVR